MSLALKVFLKLDKIVKYPPVAGGADIRRWRYGFGKIEKRFSKGFRAERAFSTKGG